jgi:phenylpropionate dioxygenase-like ring-hydroxylating dioxygenase large terminal subunit
VFADFANVWTIVGPVGMAPPGKLAQIHVAGERIVLFRDKGGAPAALIDRCPHRGAALSLGALEDGVITCPFHGWRFDARGRNCGVPWNPDAKCENLGAVALPVRELHGLLWLHTGREAAGEPSASPSLALPGITVTVQSAVWRAHWTRAMENMLDVPHLPFVHAASIGRGMEYTAERRMDLRWTPTDGGGVIEDVSEGHAMGASLTWLWPNAMELKIDFKGKLFRILSVAVPEQANTTRMIFVTMRDFARSRLLNPFFHYSNRRIAREDQPVVESALPAEIPPPAFEKSVRTDMPTLAFRKLYYDRLKGSSAA